MFAETSFFDGGYMDTFPEVLEQTNAVLAAVNLVAVVLPQLPVEVQCQVLDACQENLFAVAAQIRVL
jgi:hypothetical protein